ncbi:MAG: glycosyltransferase family 4 protein [bacterium]|nr:glycosyltransferase family 4 protein [bacterium]
MVVKRALRVAELAPLWKTIPPTKYGGSELVVSNLTEGLVSEGVDVTLFACGGSKTSGKLIEVIEKPMYDLMGGFSWTAISPYEFLSFNELFKRLNEFDIIHNHMGFHPLIFSKLLSVPIVTTLHSSVEPDFPYLAKELKDCLFVSISDAQRKLAPSLNYIATIYHGIEIDKFRPNYTNNKNYFLFIGTLSKNKGIDLAVKACHELGQRLIIAGEVRESDKDFLEKEVLPFIDGDKIKFVGEVNHDQKVALYTHAKALLFPIRWNEAFGLVMPESLACGTPVIAFSNGAIPEVIADSETGFVVDDFEEFLKRIKQVNQISRKKCREVAEKRFDTKVMVQNYINLFEKVAWGKSL